MTPEEAARILADVPTPYLLDELDRRAKAAEPPRVLFYGVWPGERVGHYMRDRDGVLVWERIKIKTGRPGGMYPWDPSGRGYRCEQTEGKLWHWYHKGMGLTVLTSWDRSADARMNCAAAFVVHALVTPETALALAREAFPRVFERIEAHLGRSVELAGLAEASR